MSFSKDIKEEVDEMKKNIKKIQSESLAYEILNDQRKQNKRMFFVWIITFVAFIGLLSYTIYLLNDIEKVTTQTEQTIEDVESIEGSNIVNGDMYGENKTK